MQGSHRNDGAFYTKVSIVVVGVALFIILGCSVLSIRRIVARFTSAQKPRYRIISQRYADEDGTATEESEAAYSYQLPRVLVLSLSITGFLDSLVGCVIAARGTNSTLEVGQWLQFGAWTFLIIQAVALFIEPEYIGRFRLSAFGACSSFLLFVALTTQNLILWTFLKAPKPNKLYVALTSIQLVAAVALLLSYSCVSRRPDVYRDGTIVDKQYTTSLIGKFAFSWPGPLLHFAATNKGLSVDDLPEIDYRSRAKTLRQIYDNVGKQNRLWKSLFWSHQVAFISQCILVTITSVTNFLPQIALLFILRALEVRDSGADSVFRLWISVFALGLSIVISSWLEAWLFFVCYTRIGQPIFQQLAAVIFGKAMRRKDIKGVAKKTIDEMGLHREALVNEEDGAKGSDSTNQEEDEDDEQKTRQSTINLVGVDSYRIATFATYIYIFPGTVLKLALAFGFLVKLIGWIPLLAGLAVPAIVTPINAIASKRYATAQDDLMKTRDKKMAVVTEALQGIRQIKFSAFENNWQRKILEVRRTELRTQWRVFKFDTTLIAIWILGPVMLSAFALAAYAIIHKSLSPSIAFTTISVFEALEMTLAVIPELITDYLDAKVSSTRVEKFLDSAEKEQYTTVGTTISFRHATIAWPAEDDFREEDRFRLQDLDLDFPVNELSVISGRTGSGKSLLLASILGETDLLGGVIQVPNALAASQRFDERANPQHWYLDGSLAFVAQIPWIENATIKANILFGLPFDPVRYQKTISACALEKDLEMLPDGDLTDIGANGINLSGGQKSRITLGRALYSRASILVLDDIFSAVDANVGRHLLEEALTGELGQGRTRIIATHHVSLCIPKAAYTLLLGDGKVIHAGTIEDLRQNGSLKAILAQDVEEQQRAEDEAQFHNLEVDDGGGLRRITSHRSAQSRPESSSGTQTVEQDPIIAPKKFTEDESREQGAIKYKVYAEYVRASGGLRHWAMVFLAFAACLAVILGRSWWISVWTRSYQTELVLLLGHFQPQAYLGYLKKEVSAVQIDPSLWFYLGIYLAWSVGQCVIGTSRYFLVFLGSIRASKDLFQQLTYAVLRAPLRWLDTIPLGRILNRFTADFNMIDSRISMDLAFLMHNSMQVMSVLIAGVFVSPWMIAFAVLLLVICMHYALRYLNGAREVKRLESISKSPIFESFGAALMGINTIRAFDKAEIYVERMYRTIDTYGRAYWHLWLFNRWMGFRLNMVGALFATITAALIVSIGGVDASLAGFALSFALECTIAVVWSLRQYANVELDMNAVERIVEYSNIPVEDQSGDTAPAAWPTEGCLEVSKLVVGYASDLPPVLKGLSFKIERNQRVGVVGRTGAGKSSLTLALFRFLEAREGAILIDGIDISKIRLQDVRSRLAIIPQDPVLFSGTVRSNLDAFEEHDDLELRDALERVHLVSRLDVASSEASGTNTHHHSHTTNNNIFRKLSSKISEGGLNLSQGQRQLLCLAREIVSRPKIMVLDEATSAVDMETDALIQRSIREEFRDSTLIVIAHRLSTIADFDKILVMGDGTVLEYDEPQRLMEKEDGQFRKMVAESGERDVLEEIIKGLRSPNETRS